MTDYSTLPSLAGLLPAGYVVLPFAATALRSGGRQDGPLDYGAPDESAALPPKAWARNIRESVDIARLAALGLGWNVQSPASQWDSLRWAFL